VLGTNSVKGRREVSGAIGVAPVSQHPLDANSPFGELRGRVKQEARGRRFSLVGVHLDDCEPGSVVDGHVDKVVASPWSGSASLTAAEAAVSPKEPMSTTCWDLPQFLHVQVKQLARALANVANRDRRAPVGIA